MKKRNLTAAFLACALCVATMAGTGCAPQVHEADAAEPAAIASVSEKPLEVAEERMESDDSVQDAAVQVSEEAAPQIATPVAPESEADAEPKPVAQAASKPQVKKSTQGSASASSEKAQPTAAAEPAIASASTEAAQEASEDDIPLVIDAVPAAEESAAAARTITINGVEIAYADSYGTASAPSEGAGIWRGSDSTTDGECAYFIGHNYTEFGDVANLEQGSVVSVTDANGASRDYEVVDSFVVPRGTLWSEVSDRVTAHGESIAMQTCVEDGYQIVVAS